MSIMMHWSFPMVTSFWSIGYVKVNAQRSCSFQLRLRQNLKRTNASTSIPGSLKRGSAGMGYQLDPGDEPVSDYWPPRYADCGMPSQSCYLSGPVWDRLPISKLKPSETGPVVQCALRRLPEFTIFHVASTCECRRLQPAPVLSYIPPRRRTHSATPVTKPSMNSGNIHSVDAPNASAATASTQQEQVIHSAIDKDSGSLSISALSGRL